MLEEGVSLAICAKLRLQRSSLKSLPKSSYKFKEPAMVVISTRRPEITI